MPVDTPDLVIDARGLRKSFGRFEALRGLDLRVRRGGGPRIPRAERSRQVDDDPRAAGIVADQRG